MNIEKTIKICIIFLFGFLSANIVAYLFMYGLESPFSNNFGVLNTGSNRAPSDFIKEKDIKIYEDKIIIDISGASLSRYAPTGSMKPLLDEGSNGIRIVPSSEDEINIGDIITFKQNIDENNYLIVHRVIEKGEDLQGTYFITKGDNNSLNDGKVRFSEIKYLTIGILY
jgi:signal peptidase I